MLGVRVEPCLLSEFPLYVTTTQALKSFPSCTPLSTDISKDSWKKNGFADVNVTLFLEKNEKTNVAILARTGKEARRTESPNSWSLGTDEMEPSIKAVSVDFWSFLSLWVSHHIDIYQIEWKLVCSSWGTPSWPVGSSLGIFENQEESGPGLSDCLLVSVVLRKGLT